MFQLRESEGESEMFEDQGFCWILHMRGLIGFDYREKQVVTGCEFDARSLIVRGPLVQLERVLSNH